MESILSSSIELVIYSTLSILASGLFTLGYIVQKNNTCLATLNQLQYSVYISRGAGLVLAVFVPLIVFSSCKYTITFLRKHIKFIRKYFPENTLLVHKTLGFIIVINVIVHTVSHYVNFYTAQKIGIANSNFIHHKTYAGISGHIMSISMFLMLIFSLSYFKTKYFEVFFYSHHFYIPIYGAFMFHSFGCFVKQDNNQCVPYYSKYMYGIPLVVYSIEKIYDLFKRRVKVKRIEDKGDLLKIYFDTTINYSPGQYINVIVPNVSKIQYHPFTITSCKAIDKDEMSIAIKRAGDWSSKVFDYFLSSSNPELLFTGAFGSPCDKIYDFSSIILVSTGVGITPFISILKDITNKYATQNLMLQKIDVIFINNNNEQYDWFKDELKFITDIITENILTFDIFLTERFLDKEIEMIVQQDLEHTKYFVGTKIPINYGRPDFVKILKNYNASLRKNVGIFSCSNENTNKSIENAILQVNKTYTFIKEPFY